ncbi:MAG: M1 family metallopeptidase [Clostridiales bacterium]|nr:M1 family metallopeptidase [Clostridiales bacterium]
MKTLFTRKRIFIGVIVLVMISALTIILLNPLLKGKYPFFFYRKNLTQYSIDVAFSPRDHRIDCSQQVRFINSQDTDLWNIYFHLYPNSFKYEEKPVFPPEEFDRAYPKGFSPGFLEIHKISLGGKPIPYTTEGYSEDILMLSPEKAIKPGKVIDIQLDYSVKLPNSPGRFGFWDNTYNIGNWYPIICVYDERGWNTEPYYPLGDPFYSDVADYKVSITAPKEFVIASTGDQVNTAEDGDQTIWELEAPSVRDFAWVASEKFRTLSKKVGETTVHSYFYDIDGGQKVLDYGIAALAIFNGMFGSYPYKNLSIVQTDFFIGGMEYPKIVMIDGSLYGMDEDDWLEIITVHEVAHQWWYGLVGNDQIHDAWMDEGLAEYSTVLYYGKYYDEAKERRMYQGLIDIGKYQLYKIYRSDENIDETIHRPLYSFEDWAEYDAMVYGKGAKMFHQLRQEMGDEAFFQVLKEYFEGNKYKNAKPRDLFEVCQEVTGQSWENFFQEWLYEEK